MTTLFLVRHALTSHTGKRLSGWAPGIHLSEDGKAQAERVAELLANVPLKAIYSSPIERAVETARAVASRHDLKVKTRRAIGEVQYGAWTNRPFKTLMRTKLWATVQRWPSAARFPDGENLSEVQARALGEIERIRGEQPKDAVCCVSHADVIRLVLAHYLGVHIDLFQRIWIAPASFSVVHLSDDGPLVMAVNTTPDLRPSRA
jgi:probable phosphomutase (TIGR03848 family)